MTALDALNLAAPLADTYNSVEQRLLVSIARQLSLNGEHQLNEVSKWQIKRLANIGMLRKDAARIIAAGTKGVPSDFADTVQQAITSALAEDGITDMWQNEGFSESAKNAVKHYRNQAKDVYNQVNTVMKYKAESSFVNAVNSVADKWSAEMRRNQQELSNKQDFLDILNSNTADVVNGSAARTKAVRTTIHEMAQKGIPAFVDRSGREWSPEAYVNMDIRATVKNTALDTQFGVMDSLGQDVFEVSSHPGSRPKCRPWQGKLISRSGKTTEITDLHGRKHKVIPLSQTSFGEPDGLFGINCGHRPRGCSEGVFTKSAVEYDDAEDKELYNKVCRQRELERRVRKSKTEADMLEAAGDAEGAKEVRRRMAEQNKALRAYCEDNGLKFRSDRVKTYGSVKPEQQKMSAGSNEWSGAKPTVHTAGELEELKQYAFDKGIKLYRRKPFDGDIDLLKTQIDNELVDGYDAASAPDNLVADRLDSAGYSMATTMDNDGASTLISQGTRKNFGSIDASTIYSSVVEIRKLMSKAKVPNDGKRYLLVTPDVYAEMLKSEQFVKASDLGAEMIQSGILGRMAGFNIIEWNDDTANLAMIAGHPRYATRIHGWKVPIALNNLADGKHIGASAVQGRSVYGHEVLRKSAVYVVFSAGSLTLAQGALASGKCKITVTETATGSFIYRVNPAARAKLGEDFTAIATTNAFTSNSTQIACEKGDVIEIIDLDSSKQCVKVGYVTVA